MEEKQQGNQTDNGAVAHSVAAGERGIAVGRDIINSIINTGNKIYSISKSEELDNYLARAVAIYEGQVYHAVARSPKVPFHPYKFLYSFDLLDSAIFFGRDAAIVKLYNKICSNRLTVFHAPSGAGKTSLLNAGVSPRLIQDSRLPVYARAYEDPILAIKRAIAPASLGPWPEWFHTLTLHEFLGIVCAHLSPKTQELIVILDQFEEFFVFWPVGDSRKPFIDILGDCHDDHALPVRFVIALRKDYYSDLATFQTRLPYIFYNEYYLNSLTREEAQLAITAPLEVVHNSLKYDQDLIERLLNDLNQGGMEPPHLQIICSRLYDEAVATGGTSITYSSYQSWGQAGGILGRYLNDVLNKLPAGGMSIAKDVFKELVSSETTKRVLSYESLMTRIVADQAKLDEVLSRLVSSRLLRRDEVAGTITYEMAHEYLIDEISKWIDQRDLDFKRAEELLMREALNWRVHGTLIPEDRLRLIHAQLGRFKGLSDEVRKCLIQSALLTGFAIEDWARFAGQAGEKPLLEALGNSRQEIRWAAVRGLGIIWELPTVSQLGDSSPDVREAAAKSLAKSSDSRVVEPLAGTLHDVNVGVRLAAAEALDIIADPHTVGPLVIALHDDSSSMRVRAAETLRKIGMPAVRPLIGALTDKDDRVRQRAAWALGKLGNPLAVEPLAVALQDETYSVRLEATEALSKLGEPAIGPMIGFLHSRDRRVRLAASQVLSKLGEPAVSPLIAVLSSEDEQACRLAASTLGKIGKSAVGPLVTALRDASREVRRNIIFALGNIGEPAMDALLDALRNGDYSEHQQIILILGNLGKAAVKPLIAALKTSNDKVKLTAAEILGEIGDPQAVEPLIAALRHKERNVRQAAAKALGRIRDPRAVQPLVIVLKDKNGEVRQAAARALREIGTAEALMAYSEWQKKQ